MKWKWYREKNSAQEFPCYESLKLTLVCNFSLYTNLIFGEVKFLVKVVDWQTDGLGIYERLTDEFVLEFRVGIYDGWIDGLWLIDRLSIK